MNNAATTPHIQKGRFCWDTEGMQLVFSCCCMISVWVLLLLHSMWIGRVALNILLLDSKSLTVILHVLFDGCVLWNMIPLHHDAFKHQHYLYLILNKPCVIYMQSEKIYDDNNKAIKGILCNVDNCGCCLNDSPEVWKVIIGIWLNHRSGSVL